MSEIVVVGGGIGGLATALALQRFGFDVEVYEQASPSTKLGAGTWVPPNGMRVLEHLGRAEAVRDRGIPVELLRVDRDDGRRVGSIEFGPIRERTGFGNFSIQRSTIREILLEGLEEGTVQFGQTCRRVEPVDGGARALFEDGTSKRADLLVGADGIESYVRGDIFGMVRLRYGGHIWFRGLAEAAVPEQETGVAREIWGGPERFGCSKVDGDRVYWVAPVVEPHFDSPVAAGARDWLLEAVPEAFQRLGAEWLYDVDHLIGMAE